MLKRLLCALLGHREVLAYRNRGTETVDGVYVWRWTEDVFCCERCHKPMRRVLYTPAGWKVDQL